MRGRIHGRTARNGLALVGGLAWAQVALVTASILVPQRLALAPRIAHGAFFLIARWTLLAPLTGAVRLAASFGGGEVSDVRPTFAVTALCALLAMGACLGVEMVLANTRWRIAVRSVLALAFLTTLVSTAVVAGQLSDAVVAERAYFALVSQAEKPWTDELTVAAARAFVARYPLSRWRSEALRILAMNAEIHGQTAVAEAHWREFQACFDDPLAPGVAYAEFSRALCLERLGESARAAEHHVAAIGVIRSRGDGIQAWIAPEAAKRVAQLQRRAGMPVTAAYWTEQSQTLQDVCSID